MPLLDEDDQYSEESEHSDRRLLWLGFCVVMVLFVISIAIVQLGHGKVIDHTTSLATDTTQDDEPSSAVDSPAVQPIACNQGGIQRLVDSVSEDNLRANLQELIQDDYQPKPNALASRYVGTPGNAEKVNWVKGQLAGYGLQQINQTFTLGKYTVDNIISRLDGTTPNNYYVISGHIDSINNDNAYKPGVPAPGADDNGSGIVAMMEAGRVLRSFKPCMKSSVEFVGFNYEEADENEWGSEFYVKQRDSRTFKGLFNMDMVAYGPADKGGDCIVNYYNKNSRDKFLADQITKASTTYGIGLRMKTVYETDKDHDTDSSNFWDTNLPSIHLYNCKEDPNYHSPQDDLRDISWTQLTKTTKAIIAATAELAMQ